MSDQNNFQQMNQGYPQQNYQQAYPQGQYNQQMNQQGYPQQQYQQDYQQGYPQQQYQQNYQQGYPQQYQQMNQGYATQGYQQPTGGGRPPKGNKPKTGLIVGIIIAAVVVIAGIILLVFKDKIFGDKDKEPKNPDTTMTEELDTAWEITEDYNDPASDEGGFSDYEELLPSFWEAFEYCDEDGINQCFYLPNAESAQAAETNYNNAVAKADSVEVHYTEMTVEYDVYGETGLVEETIEDRDILAVKQYRCEVPMTQEVDGVSYEIIDIYEGTIYQLDNYQWYLSVMKEVDVQMVGDEEEETTTAPTTEPEETGDTKPMGNDDCGYVDVPTDWVRFADVNGVPDAEASFQTSDILGTTIVTLCVIDADPYTAACNMYNGLAADEDSIEVVDSMATIGGYQAYQVYATYSDDYFVTYFFETEDGKCHYVAIEFPIDQAGSTVIQTVESSFRLTE